MEILKDKTIKAYRKGRYKKEKHTWYGYQINIEVEIDGINEKKGKGYLIKTCYMVFPEGKLRCVTLIGGKINENL